MQVSSHDMALILNSIAILNSDHFPETLPRRTFDSVKSLIPTDVISYEAFGSDVHYQGPLWFEPAEIVSEQMLNNMREYVPDHPIINADGSGIPKAGRSVKLSEVVTLPQFKRSTIYNEFFRLLGTNRQLSAGLHISPELMVSCSLCRLGKDYSRRDATVLDLLTPHLIAAFRNAQFTKQLMDNTETLVELTDLESFAYVTLDANLKIIAESKSTRSLLKRHFPDFGTILPHEMSELIIANRRLPRSGSFYLPPSSVRKATASGSLVIRILPTEHRTIVVFTEERTPSSSIQKSSLGLTKRELQVLIWISYGKTNKDISFLMDISSRTVDKHVENIFIKLGVETRTAAASFLNQL